MWLAQSIFFYGLLAFLFLAALASAVSWVSHNRRLGKSLDAEISGLRSRVKELDGMVREKEDSLRKHMADVDEQCRENTRLNADNAGLESRLADLKERLDKENASKADLAGKVSKLEEELAKARKDAVLSNQMHEGLKGQYDELEEKFSQLFQQFLEEQKKNQPLVKLQTLPPNE